jgi:hypothetical protein
VIGFGAWPETDSESTVGAGSTAARAEPTDHAKASATTRKVT